MKQYSVYFAERSGLIKIGCSSDPERRSFSAMVQILLEEALDARERPDPLGEALNSGTGVYKP